MITNMKLARKIMCTYGWFVVKTVESVSGIDLFLIMT